MEIKLGHVTSVFDDDNDMKNKFVIKFTIKEYIEDAIAYPIDEFDEPAIGDPVVIYEIESIFGYSFLYKKLRLDDYTRLKLGNSMISIFEDGIEITTSEGNDLYIDSDGGITINSSKKIVIESESLIEIKGNVKMSGTATPSGTGPFCAIPVCPYTGQPHTGNLVNS